MALSCVTVVRYLLWKSISQCDSHGEIVSAIRADPKDAGIVRVDVNIHQPCPLRACGPVHDPPATTIAINDRVQIGDGALGFRFHVHNLATTFHWRIASSRLGRSGVLWAQAVALEHFMRYCTGCSGSTRRTRVGSDPQYGQRLLVQNWKVRDSSRRLNSGCESPRYTELPKGNNET